MRNGHTKIVVSFENRCVALHQVALHHQTFQRFSVFFKPSSNNNIYKKKHQNYSLYSLSFYNQRLCPRFLNVAASYHITKKNTHVFLSTTPILNTFYFFGLIVVFFFNCCASVFPKEN